MPFHFPCPDALGHVQLSFSFSRRAARRSILSSLCLALWLPATLSGQCNSLDGPSIRFQGLDHVPLGQAELELVGDVLTVDQLGNGGSDGISLDLGGLERFETSLDLSAHAISPGDRLTLQASGPLDGIPETFLELELAGVGADVKVHPIFRNPLSTQYRVLVSLLGQELYVDSGLTGQLAPLHIAPDARLRVELNAAGSMVLHAVDAPFIWQHPDDGSQPVDRVALMAHEPPSSASLCNVSWLAVDLDQFDLTQHQVGFENLTFQTSGAGAVFPQGTTLTWADLGSGVSPGGRIDISEAVGWRLDFQGIDPSTLTAGAWVDASTTEATTSDGVDALRTLGIRREAQGSQWITSFRFTENQSDLAYTLDVLLEGESVSPSATPLLGPGATFGSDVPYTWTADIDPQSGLPTLRVLLSSPTVITPVGGAPVNGDEIQARPNDPEDAFTFDTLRAIEMQVNEIPVLQINNAKSKKKEKPQGLFPSSVSVTGTACVLQRQPPPAQIQYSLQFDNPTGQRFCFQVFDHPKFLFAGGAPNALLMQPQVRTICVEPEAFCQVGFTGWMELGARCTQRQASITQLGGTAIEIENCRCLDELPDCTAEIQICDDEIIFHDDFESGDLSQWSNVVR